MLFGCANKDDKTSSEAATAGKDGGPVADKPIDAAAKPKLPWGTDHSDKIAKLQGAWVVKGFGSYGNVEAWKFDGAKVTVYDPAKKSERPDVLLFRSPCEVRLDSGNGGTLVTDGDTVYLGLGGGGWKQGDTIIACMGSGTVYATPAGCTTYRQFGGYEVIETTCSQLEGRFVTVEKSSKRERSLRFWNDRLLLSDQLAANKLEKQPDWETAKAAADKLAAASK